MAHAICSKSGLEFTIQYFPYNFNEGQLHHPIFDLTYEELTAENLLYKWTHREFTETDTKLYFLALLNISDLVEFRTYARPTIAVCELNMEPMLDILSWINSIKHPKLSMPHMAITQDTATLDNVRNWISAWNAARLDFESGYKELTRNQLMMRREDILQRLIKDQQKELHDFAGILASWAELSAEFPTFPVNINGAIITCAEYWKQILVTCSKTPTHIWRLDLNDMKELLDHLETNLEHGTIYAHATMQLIRKGIAAHDSYLGFSIINHAQDIEQANMFILAADAPTTQPMQHEYANKILYLKAKIKWEQAQRIATSLTQVQATPTIVIQEPPQITKLNDEEL